MRQRAKITAINGDTIQCAIECGDACAGCMAKKVCATGAANEQNVKTITLVSLNANHRVGDMISVEISTAMGLRAVLIAYLIPVFIIIGLLLVLQSCGVGDLWAGLIVLGVATLYFLSIYIFRLGRTISIEIVDDEPIQL